MKPTALRLPLLTLLFALALLAPATGAGDNSTSEGASEGGTNTTASAGDEARATGGEQGRSFRGSAAEVGRLPELGVPEGFRPARRLSGAAQIYMVTIHPGLALYSAFGHTAIRVYDPRAGIDLLYNYGQSSVPFDASFVPRFVTGQLPFILGVSETPGSYRFYRRVEDRSIYEQRLLLSFEEKRELYRFLAYNALPQHRTYIYDFFFDNCTTRVRDLYTLLFGTALHYELPVQRRSFRSEIATYLAHSPYVTLGINLVFGVPADTVPQPSERLFLPFQLRDAVESATVDRGGGTAPLQREAQFIYRQQRPAPQPPPLGPAPLLWALAAAALAISLSPARFSRAARLFDTLLFLLVGAAGTAMALLWGFSGYLMTTDNFNLLWAWPLHLPAAFIGFAALRRRRWLRGYFLAAAAASAGVLLCSPLIPQLFPAGGYALMSALALRAAARGALPLLEEQGRRRRWLLPRR